MYNVYHLEKIYDKHAKAFISVKETATSPIRDFIKAKVAIALLDSTYYASSEAEKEPNKIELLPHFTKGLYHILNSLSLSKIYLGDWKDITTIVSYDKLYLYTRTVLNALTPLEVLNKMLDLAAFLKLDVAEIERSWDEIIK